MLQSKYIWNTVQFYILTRNESKWCRCPCPGAILTQTQAFCLKKKKKKKRSWKRAITPISLVDFTLNLNQTWYIFYDYIPVYKTWIQYTNLFKRYRTENIFCSCTYWWNIWTAMLLYAGHLVFVCVEVLRPSQPNGIMLSVVSLPNHTFTGQA